MQHVTTDILTDIETPIVTYSTFWQRFFASLIDGLILVPFAIVETFNKTTWKSYAVLVVSFLVTLLYKPILEYRYKATVGKMAMRLTIVNLEYQKPGLANIILRNIFDIVNRIAISMIAFITFTSAGFEDVRSLHDYTQLSNAKASAGWVILVVYALILVDGIFLIANKKRQALHDKIGKTFVVQR